MHDERKTDRKKYCAQFVKSFGDDEVDLVSRTIFG